MNREQAQVECERLAAEHPDREKHQWRPATADDPRPANFRDVPPLGGDV